MIKIIEEDYLRIDPHEENDSRRDTIVINED